MAFSYVDLVGNGQTSAFSFRFTGDGYGYFREADIHVYMDGNEVQNWSLTAPNQISFPSAPAAGVRILIRRIMPKELPYSIWKRGNDFSPLTTNNNFLQMLYAMQELYDGFMTEGFRYNQNLSMGGYRITDLADGVNDMDAVNFRQLTKYSGSAAESAAKAIEAAASAKVSEDNAKQSEIVSSGAAGRAEAAQVSAAASAQIASTAADVVEGIRDSAYAAAERTEKALADFIPLEESARASAQQAGISADRSSSEADRAYREAERAKAAADSVDMAAINARLDGVDALNATQDAELARLAGIDQIFSTDIEGIKAVNVNQQNSIEANAVAAEIANLGYLNDSYKTLKTYEGDLNVVNQTSVRVATPACANKPIEDAYGYVRHLVHWAEYQEQEWTTLSHHPSRRYRRTMIGHVWGPWVDESTSTAPVGTKRDGGTVQVLTNIPARSGYDGPVGRIHIQGHGYEIATVDTHITWYWYQDAFHNVNQEDHGATLDGLVMYSCNGFVAIRIPQQSYYGGFEITAINCGNGVLAASPYNAVTGIYYQDEYLPNSFAGTNLTTYKYLISTKEVNLNQWYPFKQTMPYGGHNYILEMGESSYGQLTHECWLKPGMIYLWPQMLVLETNQSNQWRILSWGTGASHSFGGLQLYMR